AFQFPGQGSQAVGMGADLADAHPEARALFDEADDVLGFALSRLCWEGPEEKLRATENAQPALLTHGVAAARVLASLGLAPSAAAGHSLGEFTAHVVAGSLGFADALRLVRVRGEAMAGAGRERPGTMAAIIGLDEARVERLCEEAREEGEVLVAANYNSPGQIVISGSVAAVRRVVAGAREHGARMAIELQVSGAFHSPLMAPAVGPLREALDGIEVRPAAIPVVANVDARPVSDPVAIRERLVQQVSGAVHWTECVLALRDMGVRKLVEPGPGHVLTGLVKRIDRSLEGHVAGTSHQIEEVAAAWV
ncbi:MAG TPA: ACP S-malonyltransferase, partial [Gemmatimonadota bacterium]|nr:ACP S-malonyltransferase [Gemmatimonadota bacterium]